MNKTKVLHLLQSNRFSGAENVVCQIIDMFRNDESIEMIYCCKDGPIRAAVSERNITFYPLEDFSIREVRKVVSEYKPDIIHAHDAHASVYAAIAAENVRIISHIHGNHDNMNVISLKSICYLICSMRFKRILWVSNSSLDNYVFHKFVYRKSSILRNIINPDKVREKANFDDNTYTYDCIFVGRLCEIKNPCRAIKVLSMVKEKSPNFTAAFIGEGELAEECKQMIKDLDLEHNVFLLGFQNNPLKIILNSKVLLLTSYYEGTPMCALEAMALDVPIVGTPVDGLTELVADGMTGYLSNDNDSLADAIFELIFNDSKQSEFSIATNIRFKEINDLDSYSIFLNKIYKQSGDFDENNLLYKYIRTWWGGKGHGKFGQ